MTKMITTLRLMSFKTGGTYLLLLLWILETIDFVSCRPYDTRTLLGRQSFEPAAQGEDRQSLRTTNIILIVCGVFFFLFVAVAVFRKFFLPRLRARNGTQAQQTTQSVSAALPGGPVVLTAAQLAGVAIPNPAAPAATRAATPATRRARRPRRTPSQISTKSLPAYNVEAGAEEMVLVRPRHDEMNENDSDEAHEDERSSDEIHTPLLPSNDSGENEIRPSIDSRPSGESHRTDRSSMHLLEDERGDAPPYFEVVDDAQAASNPQAQAQQPTLEDVELARNTAANAEPTRMSTLRRFLSSWTSPSQSSPQTHRNQPSTSSTTSPPRASRHRPSFSASSFLSTNQSSPSIPSLFLSRTRSNTNNTPEMMTSPSTISLISSPITHTAIRTQFAYPAGGPTPEQMKFVSSTQSLLRFGIPLDAPPAFDDISRAAGGTPRSNSNPASTPNSLTVPGQAAVPLPDGLPLRTNPSPLLSAGTPAPESVNSAEATSAQVDPASIPIPASPDPHRRVSSSTVDTFTTAPSRQMFTEDSDGEDTEVEDTDRQRGAASLSSRSHHTLTLSPSTSIAH